MKEQAKHAAEIFSAIAEGKKIEMNIAAESQPEEWKEVDPAHVMGNMHLVKHCRVLDDGWIKWGGGKTSPISAETFVKVKFRDLETESRYAGAYYWDHFNNDADIIAYKIV